MARTLDEAFQNMRGLQIEMKEALEAIKARVSEAEKAGAKELESIREQMVEVEDSIKQTWNDAGISIPGEIIRVFGFNGHRLADIQVDSQGRFITPSRTVSREALGSWILNTLGHPASRRQDV